MRMFEHNSLLSVLGGGEGEQVLDFYRCAALGLNKAIVLPALERVQKGRQWVWLQKWAHSGQHAEQVPMINCSWPSSCQHGRGLGVRWPGVSMNTRILPSKRQRVRAQEGDYLAVRWRWTVLFASSVLYTKVVCVCERTRVPEQLGWEGEKGFRKSPCMQMPSGCTVHWCDSH